MVKKEETLPRKTPAQDRSQALVDAMIEATARILVKQDFDTVTTNEIARIAGVSIGSLYQYFPNKESLIAALIERELNRDLDVVQKVIDESDELPLRQLMLRLCEKVVAQTIDHGPLHQKILPLVDDLHRRGLVEAERQGISRIFRRLFESRRHELAPRFHHDQPHHSSRFDLAIVIALRSFEAGLNAVKVEAPHLLDHQELPKMLFSSFSVLLVEEKE